MLMFVVSLSEAIHVVEWKTIISLFYLMAIVNVLKDLKFLDYVSLIVIKHSSRIFITLIALTLILSMLITNDVVLFVIVPLTLILFKYIEADKKDLEKLIIFEGISANIGSGLTPIGNPQNIFLYHFYNIDAFEFVKNMVPFEIFGILVILPFMEFRKYNCKIDVDVEFKKEWIIYLIIFMLILLCIFGFLNFIYVFPIILAVILIKKPKIDYLFLLTFIFLFVDVYGIKKLGIINLFNVVNNDVMLMIYSSLLSQIISNVPATVLLSNIYDNWLPIAYGVNVGGNGTLISSFANLITLRLSNREVSVVRFLLIGMIIYIMHLTALTLYLKIF
ncbi:Citrate transporter [Methanocaldococcus bathoardescens]|uniref:Citrate transporter n=2 Tax=Methanocaldococcus bathoardescens TaxID=1301915 RepID=A0A076LCH8_9EURY|nr:Citrate transporter [Methanocaldococcus bathoardescens]